jgi:hypothetical protein
MIRILGQLAGPRSKLDTVLISYQLMTRARGWSDLSCSRPNERFIRHIVLGAFNKARQINSLLHCTVLYILTDSVLSLGALI